MSPVSNTSSPAKRPALARRSVSSHAIISTRASPTNATDLFDFQPQKGLPAHKSHRAHVVGGGHRAHGRNPSFGKNLNKLQRLTSAHNVLEGTSISGGAHHHQRKKSAPVTPAASPRGSHVRWDGSTASLGEHKANTSMRKNYSTPALPRNTSVVLGKKALVTDRPQTAKGRVKKSVGFELGDSDSEGEWEDSIQSPESTRRGSVVPSNRASAENSTVLVDPLTFVKRPYPQIPQSRSLPESSISTLPQKLVNDESLENEAARSPPLDDHQLQLRNPEPEDIASRLLSQSRFSKAPPAMSSVLAMATPTAVDTARRNASLTNLASSHDASRHAPSVPSSTFPNIPKSVAQATSSSIEGGVSRFIINGQNGAHATSRTDSDPNTPSSFLPHYHPQTPPSPGHSSISKKAKATSPPPRPAGDGPPSRTQQKLWLQRTAALTTSPPDPHGSPALPPSSIDPVFMAVSHSRSGARPYDGARGAVNCSVRAGVTAQDTEAKHIRKAYDKTASELNVVRRFQSPTKNSFGRVSRVFNAGQMTAGADHSALAGKSVKSMPTLTNGESLQSASNRRRRVVSRGKDDALSKPSQLVSRNRQSSSKHASQVYFQDQDDVVNISDPSEPVDRLDIDHHPHARQLVHPILSTSADAVPEQGGTDKDIGGGYFASERELLLRRMWESREEVASPG